MDCYLVRQVMMTRALAVNSIYLNTISHLLSDVC